MVWDRNDRRIFKVKQNSVTVTKGDGKQRLFKQNFTLIEPQQRVKRDANGAIISIDDVDTETKISGSGSSYEVVNKNGVQNERMIRGLNAVVTGQGASTYTSGKGQRVD